MNSVAYFEDISYHIRTTLLSAKYSVKVCVAWINGNIYNPIFQELNNRGINIEIIYNHDYTNAKTPIIKLDKMKLFPVRPRLRSALMHDKFCIIDDEILITGSFNWSITAKNHFENIVIIYQDYSLIKQFLHEFEDLKNHFYYIQNNVQYNQRCTQCRSNTYNLGIFREEEGKYSDSIVQIWQICYANQHATLLSEQDEQFIHSWLLENDIDEFYDEENEYNKEIMLTELNSERKKTLEIQNYFNSNHNVPMHAIGHKFLTNSMEHSKWGEEPDWEIKIIYRDMYFRKLIPSELYNDEQIEKIIENYNY